MGLETLPGFSDSAAAKASVALGALVIVFIGLYVVLYSLKYHNTANATLEEFLTARNSSGWIAIGWSMFASAVGSWVILTPAQFGSFGGVITVLTYGFATGIPILLTGYWGANLREKFPDILSFSDFAVKQYGPVTQVCVVLLSLLNMAIFATAEYTGVYTLYSDYVGLGDNALFIVVLLAITTMSYTTYGGLKVSIITDKVQGIAAALITVVAAIFLAANFSQEKVNEGLSGNQTGTFEVNEFVTGAYEVGYATMFTLPLSLICATIFSEAWWARAWASADEKALKKGALFGALLTFVVVSFWGSVGVLVAWAGLPITDFNLVAFIPFTLGSTNSLVDSAIGVLILLLATIMAEGVIDSLMNGLGASVNGALEPYLEGKNSLLIGRIVVVIINIPMVAVSLKKVDLLQLFLLGNMTTICAFFPLFLGFFPKVDIFQRNLTDYLFPLNFLGTILIIGVYGSANLGSFSDGLHFAFLGNIFYEYEYFLVALLGTVFLTTILMTIHEVITRVFGNGAAVEDDAKDKDAIDVELDMSKE
uniref:Na+/proline symporter n=1 Tax=Aplanochytrium stocchinoi TaxID=215587 RepID=A0A7S3PNX7_9STRA|eukprot:CAMPEP_0204826008 /NCGR_PEP_ID=MMETSP1346-20131115/3774_1 /ASSEMBLY_ACC=CAM_ASM_000771 /TAXON_ID=215587 /ORGANISM="Aplanochytrium stocchinoi, Strain GSBS06" /LENGTH=535 /DNA_ID=CAMNT_0051953833 /DNA_START=223 /DNA_END=1830 /DNA_ORIENTATION=+